MRLPVTELDVRFSDRAAVATDWDDNSPGARRRRVVLDRDRPSGRSAACDTTRRCLAR